MQISGAVKNPYGLEYTTEGSSGGSGAAAAASYAPITIGTDTTGNN